jgi:hypothetical protein
MPQTMARHSAASAAGASGIGRGVAWFAVARTIPSHAQASKRPVSPASSGAAQDGAAIITPPATVTTMKTYRDQAIALRCG